MGMWRPKSETKIFAALEAGFAAEAAPEVAVDAGAVVTSRSPERHAAAVAEPHTWKGA
jgi:hypothetical protein